MAADDKGLYPLSSPEGLPIPYEILRPAGVIRQDIADIVSTNVTIPAVAELLVLYASIDCIVTFNAAASVPANGVHLANSLFIPAGAIINVDHNAATTLTVIGIAASVTGKLFVTTVSKWKDTKIPAVYNRI